MTTEMKKYILIVFLFCFSSAVFAEFPLIRKVVTKLNLNYDDCYEPLMAEKILPGSPGESVVVIPVVTEFEGGMDVLGYILVVETATGKIKSRYSEHWESDAIGLSSITIDTAPYFVKEKVRAFGIRLNYRSQSGPNPYSQELLSLFIAEGEKLLPVLHQFEVSRFNGETDTRCAGKFVEQTKVLIISKEQTNGYFNIQVKTNISDITNIPRANGDCDEKIVSRTEKSELKFKNGKYREN